MDLFIDRAGGSGLCAQLYEQIRQGIAVGRLRAGDQLPPSRQLSRQLGISRHTVTTAYERLAAEGFIRGRAGGGSLIAEVPVLPPPSARRRAVISARPGIGESAAEPRPWSAAGCRFDLRPGIPDARLFPADLWRRRLAAAAPHPASRPQAGHPAGEAELRRAIAGWISRSRSVIADEATVLVTSGAQHAIDLVARALLEPGDTVAVEDPGYPAVAALLRSHRARVVGVPVDDAGIVVSRLPAGARMVYLTPSHQYPLGVAMSMARRGELLAWAAANGAAVIEDDYDSEFRHVDRPLEPIQRLDNGSRVIYIGSFSKTLLPSLRMGFAVVPPTLAAPLAFVRQLVDWHPPVTTQLALATFIDDGSFDRHLRRARRVYGQRYRLLRDALAGPLSAGLAAIPTGAGLHITARLRPGYDEALVQAAAAELGIATTGLAQQFRTRPGEPGLVIGFGAIATSELTGAIDALGQVLKRTGPD